VSLLALMKFATIAKSGKTSDDMEGLAALYTLLRTCIADDAWDAFEDHANAVGADGEATDAGRHRRGDGGRRPPYTAALAARRVGRRQPGRARRPARPRRRRPPVRQGDPRVQQRLEDQGRPDLALVVKRAREGASTPSSTG
jgi:hypothetical protein